MIFIQVISLLAFSLTCLNLISIKTIKAKQSKLFASEKIDILIPLRNEARNVVPLLKNLETAPGQIYVLDDGSTDGTFKLLGQSRLPINILKGKELPTGWLGKNYACHQLVAQSKGEYLVFLDADVRLAPGAIESSLEYMEQRGWSFISPYPRQIAKGFLGHLIQPLLQWSWFASIPFFLAYRFPNKSMTVANGQFLIIKREAYLSSGGHKVIKSEVLDDLELARLLISNNFKGGVVNGAQIATCKMYETSSELANGYSKSLWKAFGSLWGTLFAILILFATAYPYFKAWDFAVLILCSRLLVAFKVKSNLFDALLHPFSILALIFLIIRSNLLHRLGKLQWKDRALV